MLDLSLPTGLRDLLPDHSAHLAELSGRLQQVFASFGYRRLFLPTLERLDVVERGLSAAALADVMKFVEPGSGEVVAIRPDITPQIARLYAARPDALPSPARLCYDGPVLRAREARAGRPREVYQAGVELLGVGGARYDAEALVVLAQGAGQGRAGRGGHRGGARPLRRRRHRGGRAAEEGAGRGLGRAGPQGRGGADRGWPPAGAAPPSARQALPRLAGLYGDGALQRARAFARAVPGCAPALAEVEAALKLARRRGLGEVAVDLGEARGLGYYTGHHLRRLRAGSRGRGGRRRPLRRAAGPVRPARAGHRLRHRPRVRHPGAGADGSGQRGPAGRRPRHRVASGRRSAAGRFRPACAPRARPRRPGGPALATRRQEPARCRTSWSSEPSGATRARGRSSTCSPPMPTWWSASRAATTPATRWWWAARRPSCTSSRPASSTRASPASSATAWCSIPPSS